MYPWKLPRAAVNQGLVVHSSNYIRVVSAMNDQYMNKNFNNMLEKTTTKQT